VETFEVIVIGGGTMGSGAAWALGQRGARTLVLEQFTHIHPYGSHSGQTRIIRHAYAESPDYVPLVQRSDVAWQQLMAETGEPLLVRTGGIDLAAPGYSQARDARRAAEAFDLPFEWLDGAEIRRRWPIWHLGDEWEGCYSPQTGYLRIEPALRALAKAATSRGVTIHPEEPVQDWRVEGGGVTVRTSCATYSAARLILTAGAWSGRLLASLGSLLTIRRKVLWWLAVDNPAPFLPGRFPIFLSDGPIGTIYGFPLDQSAASGAGAPAALKVANHAGGEETTVDGVDRVARDAEAADVRTFLRQNLPAVSDRLVDRAVCLYTMTADHDFLIDRHPEHPAVVFATGFSGHGFKFAPEVGRLLADLALDGTQKPPPRFALSRLIEVR
jgi:sarcosine oxidase